MRNRICQKQLVTECILYGVREISGGRFNLRGGLHPLLFVEQTDHCTANGRTEAIFFFFKLL